METKKGVVEKIKVLHLGNRPLVYFKLSGESCLISGHSLNFLADVSEGSQIVVSGLLNARNQFITKRYTVLGEPRIVVEFENSRYPMKSRA